MVTIHTLDLGLFLLRLVLGAVFVAHGVNHIFGGGKIAGTASWFESLGMKPGRLHAWTASLTEVGSGGLLILGLLSPLGCAGIVGVMLVAWITNHLKNGFFIFRPGEGWEYIMVLTCAALSLSLLGPGQWSVDDAVGLLKWSGWTGFVVTLIGGVGGAALLLIACWRPAKPEPAQTQSV